MHCWNSVSLSSKAADTHSSIRCVRTAPLRAPIEALFEAEEERFDAIRQAIRQAVTRCEPSPIAIYVYDSVARGQDKPDSDLDIPIVAEHEDDVSTVTGRCVKPWRS